MRILKGAAWTVLPSGIEKTIRDLKIEDVDLLFPEQQSFKVLRKELLEDEALFRSNKLNEPAMIQAKDVFINNFTDTLLSKVIVHHSLVPPRGMNRVYIFWDTALTAGRQSDYSAGIVFMIQDIPGKDPIAWVLEIKYDHWTSSELVYQIVALSKKWAPDCTFIETLPSTTNTFKESVRTQKIMQGTSDFMISWFKPDPAAKAKETRIKFLEILMTRGILKIVMGTWIDEMKKQLLGYTGHKSNKNYKSGRKDDIPDAMGCVHQVLPFLSTLFPKTEEEKKLDEALIARKGMLDQYRWIYGSDPIDLGGPTIKHPEGRGSDRELHSGQDINVRHPSDIQMPPSNIGPPGSYVIEEDEGMQRGAYGIPLVPKYNK